MNFKNTEVFNFEGAIRGMRNPLNSWDKSDSFQCDNKECYFERCPEYNKAIIEENCDKIGKYIIGEKDLGLAKNLIKFGPEHAKFLRQIFISVDITAPLYWWKEADTYKVGTTANSTSTMHKLTAKPFERSDFEFDEGSELIIKDGHGIKNLKETYDNYIDEILYMCNELRNNYLLTKDKCYWRALVQILPNAYLQTRTWTANYAILRNIYFQRKNHKLKEWHQFCDWIKTLPYSKELIILGDENES